MMPAKKTEVRKAAGKLVSAIQKEWGDELDDPGAVVSETVMHNCHALLHANTAEELQKILNGRSVEEFLGIHWVKAHPTVKPFIRKLESAC